MQRSYLDRPDCRIYYEVDGSGPLLVFAHGLGGNHLSWWQQVPHFRDRFTCTTFAHRGFAPSSAPPGGPDPADYAGDLAALIDHLGARDVRIVAQSMGGWSALDYALARPDRVRALVLASTAGAIARTPALFAEPDRLPAWERNAAAAASTLQAANIHVAAGERMAREQPAAHFLYQEIDALSHVDKVKLRRKLYDAMVRPADALRTLNIPTLWLTGEEDIVYPPFLSDRLAELMPNARVVQIKQAGHSVYFERPAEFNRLLDEFLCANR
ncbi:MAG: alpha/beta hydrolase [Alphaproteobacteria bacterium]|nr:MAG: alpha/beta hydrolase [Alphaproteobacteria bacterium]